MIRFKQEEHNSWSGAALFFFLGAAVGAAISALYVPQSGEETRANIMDKTHQMTDSLKDNLAGMTDQVSHKINEWRGVARDGAHEVAQELEKV